MLARGEAGARIRTTLGSRLSCTQGEDKVTVAQAVIAHSSLVSLPLPNAFKGCPRDASRKKARSRPTCARRRSRDQTQSRCRASTSHACVASGWRSHHVPVSTPAAMCDSAPAVSTLFSNNSLEGRSLPSTGSYLPSFRSVVGVDS